jgi:hypothetical protein
MQKFSKCFQEGTKCLGGLSMKHTDLINVNSNTKVGHHRVEFEGGKGHFYYYSTEICTVDYGKGIFSVDNSFGTTSTSVACGKYRNALKAKGFREVQYVNS